ncbi:hypothetical protein R1flu_023281 [Riccia fluitans]|uniref:Uncharacterized protein n=1 Tax=Riccia fluitans TaxID=41844 RepID=A0ABD1XRL9_9MARC
MIKSGQYIPGFRWLTTAKISKLRAERIWHACTSPESVEVPDMEAMFFGVETTARYFKIEEQKTSVGQGSDTDEDQDAEKDGELTGTHDEQASRTIVVELDKGMKEENPMDHLPEYFRLWD